ncbi:MAG: hypothetical protein N2484_04120 [Clostridia bacterium]|nr:hypothetical protein [Clostridia bacterium]
MFKVHIKKLKSAMKLSALLLSITTMTIGCGGYQKRDHLPANTSPTVINAVVESAQTNDSGSDTGKKDEKVKRIATLEQLYTSKHSLEIQKKGQDKSNPASELLSEKVKELLSMAELKEDSKATADYDYKKFDYILKFNGAEDILVSMDDQTYHFAGEQKVYKLWGDSSRFWEEILKDEASSELSIKGDTIEMMQQDYQQDLDGDGQTENIRLICVKSNQPESNGKLLLKVNDSQATFSERMDWATKPYHTVNEAPKLSFISKQGEKGKVIIADFSWMTNGIGSTGVIGTYEYKHGKIQKTKFEMPFLKFSYLQNGKVRVQAPQTGFTKTMRIQQNELNDFREFSEFDLKSVFKNKEGYNPHPLGYTVKDFNGDGEAELCATDFIRFQIPPRLGIGFLYTYYQYRKGAFVPVKTILNPTYDENNISQSIKNQIIENITRVGPLNIDAEKIIETWFMPNEVYTLEKIRAALAELLQEGVLKQKDNQIFVNY